MGKRLKDLLIAAGESPPNLRAQYVDEIAQHGRDAIVELIPWLLDPHYSSFAIRTIERAGELGERSSAIAALRSASALYPGERSELNTAVDRLRSTAEGMSVRPGGPDYALASLDALVPGRLYTRRGDLHSQGLGGNWQKGISYPRNGHYALLFSNPSRSQEFGYHDAPLGADRYRYFGEWSGTGDMTLTGGNRVIVERSPFLYLFISETGRHRFQGQFACDTWNVERTTRDGREFNAIVFDLVRIR